ncbi:MAG: menaquinone biosynthesis protein [Gemmatimonadota bacterium]
MRLGAVSFLNARPLTQSLEAVGDGSWSFSYALPSVCAADLRAGRIDLGLIPSIEYALSPEPYALVPDIAIGCRGEVLTVRLFYRGELEGMRTVAVDTSSRTSVALLRVILAEKYGLAPELFPAPPDLEAMLHQADAALLIGDPVLPLVEARGWEERTGRRSLDLGREWRELTGLPFVFAFWAGRLGAAGPAEVERLQRARREGQARIPAIAARFQHERAGSASLYERYLTEHIRYDLGDEELAGLAEFYGRARRCGIIPAEPEVRFFPHEAPSETVAAG